MKSILFLFAVSTLAFSHDKIAYHGMVFDCSLKESPSMASDFLSGAEADKVLADVSKLCTPFENQLTTGTLKLYRFLTFYFERYSYRNRGERDHLRSYYNCSQILDRDYNKEKSECVRLGTENLGD